MEGSLPGVPKQGNGQDAAKQSKQLSPFLAKLRKNMEKRKNRAALVSDNNPAPIDKVSKGEDRKVAGSMSGVSNKGNERDVAMNNQQRSPFLETLRKRIENKRKNIISDKAAEILQKALDIAGKEMLKMHVAYEGLKNTPYGNEGVDKYYHSVAHCKIARLGDEGEISSHALGLGKELFDVLKESFTNPNPWGTIAKGIDSVDDMKANEIGRQAGINGDPSKSCEELCKGQWPKDIPEKYKVR